MKIITAVTIVALFAISAESLPIESTHGCQLDKFFLAVSGVCPLQSEDQVQCVTTCGQLVINTQEDCAVTQECCWTGDSCSMKRVVSYEEFELEPSTEEEDASFEKQLSRTKRQSGTFNSRLEAINNQLKASADYSQKIGRDGRLTAGGSYHFPSKHWDARLGYQRKLWGGNFGAGMSYSRGSRRPSYGLSWSKSWGKRR